MMLRGKPRWPHPQGGSLGRKPGLLLTPACPQTVTSAQTWAIAMGAVGEVGTCCPKGAALSPGGRGAHSLQAKGWVGRQHTLVGQRVHKAVMGLVANPRRFQKS